MKSKYTEIADAVAVNIRRKVLMPGDAVPSARTLAAREAVSVPTAVAALRHLEREGLVIARPRSGFYVTEFNAVAPSSHVIKSHPQHIEIAAMAKELFEIRDRSSIRFGAATPDASWLPAKSLARACLDANRLLGDTALSYSYPPGHRSLRATLAKRASRWGGKFAADDIIVTAGATQALVLALRVVAKRGDIVGIESPTYFGTLLVLESLGLKALEIATDHTLGLSTDAVEHALKRKKLAAIICSPSVQNPTGASMPLAARKRLFALAASAGVPLIEDDTYGELCGRQRLSPCKAFDRIESEGNVIYCASFSKTLAPGWRVGYVVPGKYFDAIFAMRQKESHAGNLALETALNQHLVSGDHDRHLARLRDRMETSLQSIATRIGASFPHGTRLSIPKQGFLLWVELPPQINSRTLAQRAQLEGISVSPGELFSPQSTYKHHLRFNCAIEIDTPVLRAIERVGHIAGSMLR